MPPRNFKYQNLLSGSDIKKTVKIEDPSATKIRDLVAKIAAQENLQASDYQLQWRGNAINPSNPGPTYDMTILEFCQKEEYYIHLIQITSSRPAGL
jgi:hypothetical protein